VTKRNSSSRALTRLQQDVLDDLWAHGSATSEAIRERLQPRHRLKDSSIRTILRRLEARGLVTHRVEGKAFVYRAAVPKGRLAARAVRHIIDRFCAGSVEQFVLGIVEEKIVPAEELRRLAEKVRSRS
jgi:predicted transcriptional regulator